MHSAHSQLLHHYTHKSCVEQLLDSQSGDISGHWRKLLNKYFLQLNAFEPF